MRTKLITTALLIVSVVLMSNSANAQSLSTVVESPYVLPRTVVKINVTVQKEDIKKGPYAKFAQQLLGVNAPLNDKVSCSIVSSSLSSFNEGDMSNVYLLSDPVTVSVDNISEKQISPCVKDVNYNTNNSVDFSDMGIDPIVYRGAAGTYDVSKTAVREKSPEEMASAAADAIFTLRKRRFDLITGEVGDGAFGAGLDAAIKEMKRLEDEYMSLFIGKKEITQKCYSFNVVPQKDKNNYIVCRFSTTAGIVDATDMSGEPIVLAVTPEADATGGASAADKKAGVVKGIISYYRVSGAAQCKLMLTTNIISQDRFPFYQFGRTVEVVKPLK